MVGKKLAMVIGMVIVGWFGSVWASDLKIGSQ